MSIVRLGIVFVVLFLSACAPSGGTADGPRGGNAPITEAEIARASAADLYTVVQTLRPRWLRVQQIATNSATNVIVVYFGQSRMGGPESLRQIPTSDASSVTYLRPAQAQLRFGNNHASGAIVVEPAVR